MYYHLKYHIKLTVFIYIFLNICFSIPLTAGKKTDNSILLPRNLPWYENLFFKDASFNFETIRILGEAYTQGSDIGEVIATVRKIKNKDTQSWHYEWLKTADRIYDFAEKCKKNRDYISAKKAYFRASNYYRTAGFYLDSIDKRKKSIALSQKSIDCFKAAIKYNKKIKSIKIPYENTTLPGYLIKPKKTSKKTPLLILFTGFDGTKEELYFSAGKAASERGYTVIMFDGPGQGEALRMQNLYFRPDWEKVISPVIDYAEKLSDINKRKIAIMGRSMGGYLAPRAAAFDERIKACIANGGVFDFSENILENFPPKFLALADTAPGKFDSTIRKISKSNIQLNWFIENGMWTFNTKDPAEFILKLKEYNLRKCADKIKCPVLVIDSADDLFMKGQPEKLYNELNCKKTFMLFDYESTGEAHCQEGATAISNERIFNWLNSIFR
jgi:cephalosporin-C deacetylase-like acetyl esterase